MSVTLAGADDLHGTAVTPTSWTIEVDRSGRDLRGIDMPFSTGGSTQVLLAGYLVNARDIAAGHGSPTASDADVVREAVSRSNATAVLPRLRGRFAVAIADRDAGNIRVARDPFGAHPLFYAETPRAVVFSSSIRTLLRRPDVPSGLNRTAIADHLCKRWPHMTETFFDHVHRVPPGWQAVVRSGHFSLERYWHPVGERIEWLPDDEIERFDALLDQAVARGLMRGPAGIFLSGGFDSVSVAAVAADLASRRDLPTPMALSLGFPDPACNEQSVQAAVATTLGLPFHLRPFFDAAGPRGLLAEGLQLNAHLDAPLFNTWTPAYLSLMQQARRGGATTILTGEGGDEWLGTTPFLAADLIRRADVRGLIAMVRTWKRSYRQTWPTVVTGALWRYGMRPLIGAACAGMAPARWDASRTARVVASTPRWIAPDPVIAAAQAQRARASLTPARPEHGFYERESRLFLDHPLNSWLFEEQYAIGGGLGLDFVHPYWDPDLVAHVYRVKPERLNAHDRTKALVRQTVAMRFPQLGFERHRKVAAIDFFASILRREAPAIGEGLADFRALAGLGIVAPSIARDFVRSVWPTTPREMGVAWNLLNMEHWARVQLAM